MDDDLEAKLRAAVEYVKNMSPEEYREMIRKQGESWARAEASWPAPKFKMVNGVKVYESYEDYLNG